jgi:hypothetical protein
MRDSDGKLTAEMMMRNMSLRGTIDNYNKLRAAADADAGQSAKL